MPTADEFLDAPDEPTSLADHFLDGGDADSFLYGPKMVQETPWRAPSLVPPIQDIQSAAPELGKAFTYSGNVARAIPADVAAGLSVFKRPPEQPATLIPSPAAITGAIRKNLPDAASASGNIPAALSGEQMPIDEILSNASKEDKTAATIGKISQGIAATAPMAAIGALPAAAQKLALIGFTAKMMSDAPELATQLGDELGKPEDQRDPDKLTSLISDAVQVVGFSALGATHLTDSGRKVVSDYARGLTPRGQGISPSEITTAGEPNAILTESAQPVRGLRPRDEIQQVPTEVSGEKFGIGGGAPLEEPARGPEPIRNARQEAAAEITSTEPKGTEPAPEQALEPPRGPAPEAGAPTPGGGMYTKSPSDQARQAEANRKMREEFGAEVGAVEDLRTQEKPIELGVNRPDIENPSLKILSDSEFDAEFRSAKSSMNKAEKALDEIEDIKNLTTKQRQTIADAQDRWSAASVERLRRNNLDIHTEDVFRQMVDLADKGSESDYVRFKVLANILKERGSVKQSDATGAYSNLPDRLLSNPDFKEALSGKLEKVRDWIKRIQSDQQSPRSAAAPSRTKEPWQMTRMEFEPLRQKVVTVPARIENGSHVAEHNETIGEPDPRDTRKIGDTGYFYRSGKLPASGFSRDYRENKPLRGVSVYNVPRPTSFAGLVENDWYYGKGKIVGFGSDGEPLIKPIGNWRKFSDASPNHYDLVDKAHRAHVEDAIREGKPVPAEVLKDYPDLQPPDPSPSEAVGNESQTTTETQLTKPEDQFLETFFKKLAKTQPERSSKGFVAVSGRDFRKAVEAANRKLQKDARPNISRTLINRWDSEHFGVTIDKIGDAEIASISKRNPKPPPVPRVQSYEPTPPPAPISQGPSAETNPASEWASATESVEPMPPESGPVGEPPKKIKRSQAITENTQKISEIQEKLSEIDSETRRVVKKDKVRSDAAFESGLDYAPSESLRGLDKERSSLLIRLDALLKQEREDRITRKSQEEVSKLKSATPEFPKPEIHELGAGVPLPKFEVRKMTPLDVATTRHSAKMQLSESNARRAVKEIRNLAKNEDRQSAVALWVEAGGDAQTLQGWASAARGKKFKQAAIAAQSLTPEEIALGRKVISAFQELYQKGVANDVVTNFRDNYITHIWERPKGTGGFGGGTLKQNFKFNKARTFSTFFEGDQAGFIPKTLALERIVPAYIKEMDSVIAARQFVKDMAGQFGSDGRPLVIPRGTAKEVTGASGTATLVFPKSLKNIRDSVGDRIDQSDYKTMENQPALQKWSWVAQDRAGKPIMLQADLSLHPNAYKRIQAMLGTSVIKEWYNQPSEGTAKIPKVIVKALDSAQSEMKKSMFGLLAPFHQVQEGWHGIGHTVNPTFGIPKIDLRNPDQLDAAAHGLMLLPDKASASSYLEGSGSQGSLLVKGLKKVPALRAIGEVSEMYQDYLFHQYIPGLKFKTYEHVLERNTKRFQSELASGEVALRDVKLLSAKQSDAAYGHLNYALLDRNPTIQHIIKMAALAPDFLEARGRFIGQAIKGLSSKVGQEQLRAIAFLAATQAGSAFVISQLLGTPYDPKHPFEVVYNGRRYTFRSVPEDIFSAVKDTRSFAYSRMNPLIAKGAIQYTYGLNYRGEKVSALETTEELLAGYIPIIARSLPGVRELTETSRRSPTTPLQQLSGSLGMRISRFSPISETYSLANDWKDEQKLPKDTGSYPVSKYQQLRYALEDGDMGRAGEAYAELRKTMTPSKITTGFSESVNHPFTGSTENDRRFKASLEGYDKEMYDLAVRTRANILNAYRYVPKK